MPKETLRNFISKNNLVEDINAKVWKPIHRNQYLRLSDLEIVNIYNAEIRGMYNYYRLAENVTHKMWQLRYVMEYSCLKTLAGKHQSSVHKMINKLRNGKHWGIKYNTKKVNLSVIFITEVSSEIRRLGRMTLMLFQIRRCLVYPLLN